MKRRNHLLNGPYLLSPGAHGMTIAWEMEADAAATVSYGEAGSMLEAAAKKQRVPACRAYPEGCWLYTVRLSHLKEDTQYQYAVHVDGVLCRSASFRTLCDSPARLHLMTISDTQLFSLSDAFSAVVREEKPSFILHIGDISFGTGYQHEQYTNNWFQRIPKVLGETPVFYITGNHDDGPFFTKLFAEPQARHLETAPDCRSFSVDYGTVHLVMVDSTPWGLFEMNAENSGVSLDAANQRRIKETLDWLEADLTGMAAKTAQWRILVTHHPYTDVFNNRHIVPIAEKCGVHLVLGGHLHSYVKAVSVNPAVGARTVYVMQGNLQEAGASCAHGTMGRRLLEEFPEVVAMGKNNYGILDITEDAIDCRMYGFLPDGSRKLVDTVHLEHGEPALSWSDIRLRRLDNDGHIEVEAVVQNVGTVLAEAVLRLVDNGEAKMLNRFGERRHDGMILLKPGEKQSVSAIYHARTPGMHTIEVGDEKEEFSVFEPQELSFSHLHIRVGEGDKANCIFADIEAVNNLDHEVFTTIPLYVDQRVAETQSAFFRARERRRVTFAYALSHGGAYSVSVADQLPEEARIEGSIRVIPRVLDRSGCGHYALLQGAPKVVERAGRREVILAHDGDYIEIPPAADLSVPQGFTGMVWAQVDRLARPDEMGHNPLMMRGKSVGWGAAYCLRMVVDRTGSLKWGTCYDVTEYPWQGGQAKVGAWGHYTSAFDKKSGGSSYIDGNLVAHVPGVPARSEICQWADMPLFIGYSYIGHVIPAINRPKYYTHLAGRIAQVRFYRRSLTEEENRTVYESPEEAGPGQRKLAVWLDFRHILTVGAHTTEWRHPAVLDPAFKTERRYWRFCQLRAKTRLPIQAGLKATVEVSDDKTFIKASKKIVLKDGTSYVDLSELPASQYLRIVTDFSAQVGASGTFVPELFEYEVTAKNELDFTEMLWATRPDWERGQFSGAIGFPPVDRLRDYPKYTDVIHG